MSKLKKRLWMGTGVVVALAVVVGVVYAAIDEHDDGVRIYTKGVAAGDSSITVPGQGVLRLGDMSGEDDGGMIVFGEDVGNQGHHSFIIGREVWGVDCLDLEAFQVRMLGDESSVVACWDVGMYNDSGASVEATDDGDVIITLGS
jgi:hypothetical protein